jgi:uncharacterized membrane protein
MNGQNLFSADGGSRRILLLLSLALNVFLLFGAGSFWAHRHWGDAHIPWGGGPLHRFEALAQRMTPADAEVLRAEVRKRSKAIDEAHEALHHAQDAIRKALRAEPYDNAAVRTAMSEAKDAYLHLEGQLQDVIASAAEQISAQGRAQLAGLEPGRRPPPAEAAPKP